MAEFFYYGLPYLLCVICGFGFGYRFGYGVAMRTNQELKELEERIDRLSRSIGIDKRRIEEDLSGC